MASRVLTGSTPERGRLESASEEASFVNAGVLARDVFRLKSKRKERGAIARNEQRSAVANQLVSCRPRKERIHFRKAQLTISEAHGRRNKIKILRIPISRPRGRRARVGMTSVDTPSRPRLRAIAWP